MKKEHTFLKEADSRALLHARENLDAAYNKFFNEGFVLYSQDGQTSYKCVSPSFLLKYH